MYCTHREKQFIFVMQSKNNTKLKTFTILVDMVFAQVYCFTLIEERPFLSIKIVRLKKALKCINQNIMETT